MRSTTDFMEEAVGKLAIVLPMLDIVRECIQTDKPQFKIYEHQYFPRNLFTGIRR